MAAKKIWKQEDIWCDLLCSEDALSGKIDDIISKLQSIKKDLAAKGYRNLEITLHTGHENVDYSITGKRIETDEEFKRRLKRQEAQKKARKVAREKKKERELAELARLKKKYEKKLSKINQKLK